MGKDYTGVVKRMEGYGAFIEIIPGTEGLLHISQAANYRIREMQDEMKLGDEVLVRVIEIDRNGKVKLSRRELMEEGKVEGRGPVNSSRPERFDRDQSSRHSSSSRRDRQPRRGPPRRKPPYRSNSND